jgi:hypothetical protein
MRKTTWNATFVALVSGTGLLFVPAAANAQSASWPSVQAAPQVQADASKDAALIIGIEEYAFVPRVDGAAANARDWFTFLVEGQKMPISRAHLLRNRDGTREQILDMAKRVANEVEPGGKLWIIFIGHGAPSADGKDGMLVGVDAQQTASGLYARSIAQHEILDAAGAGLQSNTIMVVDACFSGRTGSGAPLAPGLQPLIRLKEAPPPKAGRSPTTILSAGRSDQFAGPLPGVNRPAFSYLVLGALRGWGDKTGKGVVTAEDAADYAKLALSVVPIGRTQTPEITSPNAKVELAHGAKEKGPELSRIVSADAPSQPSAPTETAKIAPAGPAAPAPALGTKGHLRVKATCGATNKILADAQGLVVEEVLDTTDTSLLASSSTVASMRYDEATHERRMMDPEWVDYDLSPGQHRIRVRAKRCVGAVERVNIEPGKTFELAPKLEVEVVPLIDVRLERPEFAGANDKFELKDADGAIVCEDLPCAAKIPAKENGFTMAWHPEGSSSVVNAPVNDPGPDAKDRTLTGQVHHKKGTSIPGVVALGIAGTFLYFDVLALLIDKNQISCTYTLTAGGTATSPGGSGIFGGCPSALAGKSTSSVASGLSDSGTAEVAILVGGVILGLAGGAAFYTGWGGKDLMSVTVGGNTTNDDPKRAAAVKVHLTPGGMAGTF